MAKSSDYKSGHVITWCPGCGNFAILNAVKRALQDRGIAPHEIIVATGIGCGSKLHHYMTINGIHTLHGRPVPVAQGAKLANHAMKVAVIHGDGDGYGEGLGHFAHVTRRNPGITEIVQNNKIYGLTKGQYSPTSDRGKRTPTSPEGVIEYGVQPLALAITHGATFVARGYSGDLKELQWLIGEAMEHHGYALVDVLQPCVTFNSERAYDFYNERVYKLEDEEGYDPADRAAAWQKAQEWGERIPTGIFYRVDPIPTYEDQLPALKERPLVEQPLEKLTAEEIELLLDELR